jgi:hypothetical protein
MAINSRPKAVAEKVVVEYLHRVQAVVWMRCLMLTTEQKILGLVPAKAKRTTSSASSLAAASPWSCEEWTETSLRAKSFTRLLENVTCHGMMDGEASGVLERRRIAKELDVQEFELI